MSNSNTLVESAQNVITRSKAKQDNQLAKIVDQNQIDSLKLKISSKIKGNLIDNTRSRSVKPEFPYRWCLPSV